jgi:RNA-binding protein
MGRPVGDLKGSERRALRALGHHLKAVLQVGVKGVTDELVEAVDIALKQHELIKLSINSESPTERAEGAQALAKALNAEIAQLIGRTILLYRPNDDAPKLRFVYQGGRVSAEWLPKGVRVRSSKGVKRALAELDKPRGTKKAQARKAKEKAKARALLSARPQKGTKRSPKGGSRSR